MKKTEPEFVSDNIALLPEHGLIVNMGEDTPAVPARTPKPKDLSSANKKIAAWGDNNDFPQLVIDLAAESTELAALLGWKARALQGRRIVAVDLVYNPIEKKFEEVDISDLDINKFLLSRTTKRYYREAAVDFFWFWNVFPDLIKNEERNKIAYIGTHDASFCRWELMNDSGVIEHCYVSPNWKNNPDIDSDAVMKIGVVDPYDPAIIENLKENTELKRFVYPISYPSPGKSYYQLSEWDGYRVSKWPALAKMAPENKATFQKFLLSAAYTLSIPINYWPAVHLDWIKKSPAQQLEIKKAKVKEINEMLTGVENKGKTILIEVGFDQEGRPLPGWEIVPIKRTENTTEGLEDSREASQHLRSALSLDSALTGDGPSKTMGAGSGSDKRIAMNIYVALQQPYREVILEPLYFIAEYNGWTERYPLIQFKTVEIQLETLDKSHKTSKEVVN